MSSVFHKSVKYDLLAVTAEWDKTAIGEKIIILEKAVLMSLKRLHLLEDVFGHRSDILAIRSLGDSSSCEGAAHLFFFAHTAFDVVQSLVDQICSLSSRFPHISARVYFIPEKTLLTENYLQRRLADLHLPLLVQVSSFDLDLVELEEDFFQMSLPCSFRRCFLSDCSDMKHWISRLLLKLQATRYGQFANIVAKGDFSCQVVDLLKRMEEDVGGASDITCQVDSLFLIDRTVDLVTPLMSQLTYEGLIDDQFGIDCCEAQFPFPVGEGSDQRESIVLDSEDKVFAEIRARNLSSVGAALYQKSLWVKQKYDQRAEVNELKQLKEFVKTLPEVQELHKQIGLHYAIAHELGKASQNSAFRKRILIENSIVQQVDDKDVLEYIEECIHRKESLNSVLRLLCLYSVVNSGLKPKDYEIIREALMLSYGIPLMLVSLARLEECGLLCRSDRGTSKYPFLRKKFRLWSGAGADSELGDMSQFYNGYTPLLVKLVEALLDGPSANSKLDAIAGAKRILHSSVDASKANLILLFVVGGITSSELSAVRFLNERLRASKRQTIIVISTGLSMEEILLIQLLHNLFVLSLLCDTYVYWLCLSSQC